MKLKHPTPVTEIAAFVGAKLIGDASIQVERLNEIHKIKRGSLVCVEEEKYINQAVYSSASAILIDRVLECPPNKALLVVANPFEAFNKLTTHFNPYIAMTANVSPTAHIGKNTIIEANVVIGDDVVIGDECLIRANTTICNGTKIGNKVIIHPNTIIGSDAFCFHRNEDKTLSRWHSAGCVEIHDEVEIGAGCTIDKGITNNTCIGLGTKIDDQVHIGHSVEIGKYCLIAAQVGIAGKTIIQDYVEIYGQAGISEALVIGEGAIILAQTGVSKSIPGGKTYFGSPASEARSRYREIAALRQLPNLLRQFDKLTGNNNGQLDSDNEEN